MFRVRALVNWFIPEFLQQDRRMSRRARSFIISGMFLSVLLIFYISYYAIISQWQFILFIVAEVVMLGLMFLLRYTGRLIALTNLALAFFSFLLWFQTFKVGGIYSPHLFWVSVIPPMAFLFAGKKTGLLWSLITMLLTVVVFFINGDLLVGETISLLSLNSLYYLKAILPFFIYLTIIILSYEDDKIRDISFLEEANKKIELQHGTLNEQFQEIERQKKNIEFKNIELDIINSDLTASLYYAKYIQNLILPTKGEMELLLPDHFVVYMPKNIVSGDFYKVFRVDDIIVLVAADCTGHGVPGAFMSMLGTVLLNHIVLDQKITDPKLILKVLNKEIRLALNQENNNTRDGMDISIVAFKNGTDIMTYSGAMSSALLVHDGELSYLKGDRIPIGGKTNRIIEDFTLVECQIQKNTMLYLFSDGIVDQFGEDGSTKFGKKRFQSIISEICSLNMPDQKAMIEKQIKDWQGEYQQLDDIMVLGIRLA